MGSRFVRARHRIPSAVLGLIVLVASSSLTARSASSGAVTGCESFTDQAKAQSYFLSHGGPSTDPVGLDADNDGIACNDRPGPYRGLLTIAFAGRELGGTVVPGNGACAGPRDVAVFKVRKGKTPKRIGIDALDTDGRYAVAAGEAKGSYFAKIAKAGTCAAERSATIVVPDVRRLEITPNGLYFPQEGDSRQLEASFVDDATGERTPATGAWFRSSDNGTIAVSRDGIATSVTKEGSAQITATVGTLTSAPILAVAASLNEHAIPITDEYIESGPALREPDADPTFDALFTMVFRKLEQAPEVDQLLVGIGEIGFAGVVDTVTDLGSGGRYEVLLRQVAIGDVLPQLTIDERFDLGTGPVEVDPETAADFDVSRSGTTFTYDEKTTDAASRSASAFAAAEEAGGPCKVDGGPSAPIKFEPLTVSFDINPQIEFKADGGKLQRFAVSAKPEVKISGGFTIQVAGEVTIECEITLHEFRKPAPGLIGFVLGAQVPVSVVITAGGKLTLANITVKKTTSVSSQMAAGIACPDAGGGTCEFFRNVTIGQPDSKVQTGKGDPLSGIRFEPELSGVLRVTPSIGAHHIEDARLQLANIDGGAKIGGAFGTFADQVNDETFSSEYAIATEGGVQIAPQMAEVAKKFGLDGIVGTNFKPAPIQFAESPKGSLRSKDFAWQRFDDVPFVLELDVSKFVGMYNVETAFLVRRKPGAEPEILKEVAASPGQTTFKLNWRADQAGGLGDEFYGFVISSIFPWDDFMLEIGRAVYDSPCARPGSASRPHITC